MKYSDEKIRQVAETRVFKRLITEVYPTGVVSIVSDTFDFWHAITEIAPRLKDEILARTPDSFGLAKVVFRPDSGDPVRILCGYKYWDIDQYGPPSTFDMEENGYTAVKTGGKFYQADFTYWPDGSPDSIRFGKELMEAEVKGAVECLWDIFGGTINEDGYRTLNQRVGLIYGDSITPERCEEIMKGFKAKKFASDNTVLGIGSYTFQYNTRDTLGFAMKATSVVINGKREAIYKDPKTDAGTKKSARGLLKVVYVDNNFKLIDNVSEKEEEEGELRIVFEDGVIKNQETLETIRARLAEQA